MLIRYLVTRNSFGKPITNEWDEIFYNTETYREEPSGKIVLDWKTTDRETNFVYKNTVSNPDTKSQINTSNLSERNDLTDVYVLEFNWHYGAEYKEFDTIVEASNYYEDFTKHFKGFDIGEAKISMHKKTKSAIVSIRSEENNHENHQQKT